MLALLAFDEVYVTSKLWSFREIWIWKTSHDVGIGGICFWEMALNIALLYFMKSVDDERWWEVGFSSLVSLSRWDWEAKKPNRFGGHCHGAILAFRFLIFFSLLSSFILCPRKPIHVHYYGENVKYNEVVIQQLLPAILSFIFMNSNNNPVQRRTSWTNHSGWNLNMRYE